MDPDRIKQFMDSPQRARKPFGGEAAPGFGAWIETTYGQMRDLVAQFTRPGDMSPPARLARDSREHYRRIRYGYLRAQGDVTPHSRDYLETDMVDDVIRSHGWAAYAREQDAAGIVPEDGKRTHVQMTSAYVRSCLILAQYLGIESGAVVLCEDDQDKLLKLGNAREGK